MEVKIGKRMYRVSDEEIMAGDYIWCENSKSVDRCVENFKDGSLCVQLKSSFRAILSTKLFKKLVKSDSIS